MMMGNNQEQDENVLTEQEKELIALYGSRIEEVRWCFENDEVIRLSKIEDKDQPPKKSLNVKYKMRQIAKK